jgi:hypothetical protein
MPKKKDGGKKYELVRLPYCFKFQKRFKEPCSEWLEMIETMCNEILRNYKKNKDHLVTVAFDTRPKRRLNRVMDALNFEYLDYDRLDEGARGAKRKRWWVFWPGKPSGPSKKTKKLWRRWKQCRSRKCEPLKNRNLLKNLLRRWRHKMCWNQLQALRLLLLKS